MASHVVEEEWHKSSTGSYVLSKSSISNTYYGDKWRNLFHGVNQLPICAIVAPASWMRARVKDFSFQHDLSEDYALHLLLLTAPDLPRLHELGDVLCNISIREDQSNTVTMTDRRPWVRDISNFLNDLLLQNGPIGNGTLQLLSGAQGVQSPPGSAAEIKSLRDQNRKLNKDILGLTREIRSLREVIDSTQDDLIPLN